MRKNFGSKTWMYPLPVLIVAAYDGEGRPNAMNAAWGGIYTDNIIGICLSEGHRTTQNILASKALTVSFATADMLTACDYVGIVSGNNEPDKFAKAGFHATRSEFVNAPLIDELPVALECELLSYDPASCYMTARIVNVSASDEVLGDNGRIDPSKASFITFDPVNNAYLPLGAKVGNAFSDGKALK